MKSVLVFLFLFLFSVIYSPVKSQGFIAEIETDDIGVILNNPATVLLQNGDTLKGKLSSASLINGYLKNITLKMENGDKRKLQASEMSKLWVKASALAKMAMLNESGSSIVGLANTNFDEIINREYIIFEQALRATKKEKQAMMQLLNPGFDHVIKVYADPDANETGGFKVNDVAITGGKNRSYLFVKGNDKVVYVRKINYRKNFDELYQDCEKMLKSFEGDKIKFDDLAGHVFAYDQLCNK